MLKQHQNICEFDFRPQLPVTILRFVRKVPAARRHANTHQEVLRGAAQVGHCLAMHNYMRLVHAVAKEPMAAIHHYNLTRSRQVTLSLLPPVLAGPDSRGHELGRGSCRTLRIPRRPVCSVFPQRGRHRQASDPEAIGVDGGPIAPT